MSRPAIRDIDIYIFTYFLGSTKFPFQWWPKKGGGGDRPAPPLARPVKHSSLSRLVYMRVLVSMSISNIVQ